VVAVEQPPADDGHCDAADEQGGGAQIGPPPGGAQLRPERQQSEGGEAEQRPRVGQVAGAQEEPGDQGAPLDQRQGGEEDEGGRQHLRPGEPDLVDEEGRGRGEEDGQPCRSTPGEPPHQLPEGEESGAGEGHHRQPVGHEPLRVEREPGLFGHGGRRLAAGG
jgi:hypothetical protein